ncbi:SMI1/KNR4 family protein [Streptomyces sp. NPDC006798]|uniref:SMI1/KNR4 family protein n=1 Tax=Streptomyces sp. NPDC006798 TaxID=3155462 RepID=UPI0033E9371D
MIDDRTSAQSIHTFATWEPVLRLLRADRVERYGTAAGGAIGRIGRGGWSLGLAGRGRRRPREVFEREVEAVLRVREALEEAGTGSVAFAAEFAPSGAVALRLLEPSPAVEPGIGGPSPGALMLVEGAVPEPWRRLPAPVPGVAPAPSADPGELGRMLRERLPGAVGATEGELAAAERRLGVELPAELKALYRVTRGRWEDRPYDPEAARREARAVGCELLPPDDLYIADAASRPAPWGHAALEAVVTPPGAAVQGLVGSPGWLAFGDNGGGDRLAVDLTPGPGGHLGQIIRISHEEYLGADLVAASLTDLVAGRLSAERHLRGEVPAVARVNNVCLRSVGAGARPELEVLSIGVRDGPPLSLAPVTGLPRLRTLTAAAGTLADPLEIARIPALEYLEIGPDDWRVLLDAGAVPRTLSAAAVDVPAYPADLRAVVSLVNEILALWDRPPITETLVEGELGAEA